MKPQKMKNLFLRQSYKDAWDAYERSLTKSRFINWDYCILTASNEEQAGAYREQIEKRQAAGRLPSATTFTVLPDPDGRRVGSGGATFNVLKFLSEEAAARTEDGPFRGRRILVIHSGGDSKRIPQYSACGKLFSPVPRELPDGRRSTLFDELIIGMSGIPARFREGMLVLSGDVLLLFNPLQIDSGFHGAAAVSVKEKVEIGKNHGVYLGDGSGFVGDFLHKQTEESLRAVGAVNGQGDVDLDTGAVLFDCDLLDALFSLISENGTVDAAKYARFVNERARISFYGDFLYPLATHATLEGYLKEKPEGELCGELLECRKELWEVLHPFSIKLLCLAPAKFIHFGTTGELLELVTDEIGDYEFLDWKRQILGVEGRGGSCAFSNSYIEEDTVTPESSYIEDSYIYSGSVVGEGCVVSAVTLKGQTVPDHTVLHGLKENDGSFVVRFYGAGDNPKERLEDGATFMGAALTDYLTAVGLGVEDVWEDEGHYLWDAKLYPACDTIDEAVDAAVTLIKAAGGKSSGEFLSRYRTGKRLSLKESFENADTHEILAWQEKLGTKVRTARFLRAVELRKSISEACAVFGKYGITDAQIEKLTAAAGDADFGVRMRIYYYLSKMTAGRKSEELEDHCFRYICDSLYQAGIGSRVWDGGYTAVRDEVEVELPVRVNFGGGWSDTPPYCNENGGTVLNAALSINGRRPVHVVVKKIEKPCIALASTDSGAYDEFTSLAPLQNCRDPFDTYALHKAALLVCGIVPGAGEELSAAAQQEDFDGILERLGGGMYLSTAVEGIPRGSGLGTSSILAGACVKALFEFTGRAAQENELYTHVLCMEQLMSTGGGWQDQVGGLTDGIKLVSTAPGLCQDIKVEHLSIPEHAQKELEERFVLIYTGQRRLARNLLRDVVGKYIGSDPDTVEVLSEIQRRAVLMKFELEKGDIDAFAGLLDEHWELSKRLDSGSTNTCIEQIFLSCEDLLDARMICGAGGGGFLQAVLKKGRTKEELHERLRAVFQDSGVDVWDCELV